MNSDQIFSYSENFLTEIIDDLIKLKIQKIANPKSNEFHNKLKSLMGKSLGDKEFSELISLRDNDLKKKIFDHFNINRNERTNILGENQSKEIEKKIFLQLIDLNWKNHIQYLEQLRQVIGLRCYSQRDPLIEYKKEAFSLFSNLLEKLKLDYITVLMNLKIISETEENKTKKKTEILNNPKCLLILKKNEKISRNDRCEATGKKFKNCCGAL